MDPVPNVVGTTYVYVEKSINPAGPGMCLLMVNSSVA